MDDDLDLETQPPSDREDQPQPARISPSLSVDERVLLERMESLNKYAVVPFPFRKNLSFPFLCV